MTNEKIRELIEMLESQLTKDEVHPRGSFGGRVTGFYLEKTKGGLAVVKIQLTTAHGPLSSFIACSQHVECEVDHITRDGKVLTDTRISTIRGDEE